MKPQKSKKNQKGAVTLLTALVLLISITLVTVLSSKTVLVQMQIAADNYRIAQAVAAANAALDFGIGYFDGGPVALDSNCQADPSSTIVVAGFDHNSDNVVDSIPPKCTTYISKDTALRTTATLTFNNAAGTRCVATGITPSMKSGLITAVGYSDDGLAQRTISQCVGAINVFGNNNPKQAMLSRGAISLSGNYSLINRFNNTNIWSGGDVNLGQSAAAGTYLRPIGTSESAYTQAQLEQSSTATYTSSPISELSKGNGVDIITNDPGLAGLTADTFFNNFFYSDRSAIQNLAQSLNQVYSAAKVSDAQGKSGFIWINGDASINGGTYGSATSPVIMIINGNLTASGTPDFNGLLYVRGQLDAKGTVGVLGSLVVEGDASYVPIGENPVVGTGGVDLIYSPYTLDKAPNPIVGTTTAISGSWRDW